MKSNTRAKVFAGALILALIAAGLVYMYLSKYTADANAFASIVVAKNTIPAGTIIDAGMLDLHKTPQKSITGRNFFGVEQVAGMVSVQEIPTGEPVTRENVSQKYRLSQIIKPSMRAVTIALDQYIGVGGFLKAGDHVDVIATFNVNRGTITKTVLQDVELIAIGPEIVEESVDPDTGRKAKPKIQTNATLAVYPADAEKLVLAESKGKLRLALRRSDDPSFVATPGITGRGMLGSVPSDVPEKRRTITRVSSPAPARKRPTTKEPVASPPAQTDKTVQIIRGAKVEDASVPE